MPLCLRLLDGGFSGRGLFGWRLSRRLLDGRFRVRRFSSGRLPLRRIFLWRPFYGRFFYRFRWHQNCDHSAWSFGGELVGAVLRAHDRGAGIDEHAVSKCVVAVVVSIEPVADGFAGSLCDLRQDFAGAPREVRVDDENIIPKHDPGAVRGFTQAGVALPGEDAGGQLAYGMVLAGGQDEEDAEYSADDESCAHGGQILFTCRKRDAFTT